MGYRDLIAKLAWTEKSYTPTSLYTASALGLNGSYLANGWTIEGTTTSSGYPVATPDDWWTSTVASPQLGGSCLFLWIDDFGGPPYQLGPNVRYTSIKKTLSGLTPGTVVGLTFQVTIGLDTGAGDIYLQLETSADVQKINVVSPGITIWDVNDLVAGGTYSLQVTIPGDGNLTISMGGENFAPSCNINCIFDDVGLWDTTCGSSDTSYELLFPYPPEDVRSYRRPMPGSQRLTLPSGESDAWTIGQQGIWECEARWIPAVSALTLPDNDGWEDRDDSGTTRAGWDRFLRHARAGGTFTFYPDATDAGTSYDCAWDEAAGVAAPSLESDMTRLQPLRFRTLSGALVEGYSQ